MTSLRFGIVFALLCAVQIVSAQEKPNSSGSLLEDAAQSISAGKLQQAENDLRSVLRSTPNDARALDLMGVVRVLQHRESDAEELFKKAIQTHPQFAPSRAHLGLLYLQLGRAQDALVQLREAVKVDPARSDAVAGLVHVLEEQSRAAVNSGDAGTALTLLGEASKDSPENPDVQYEFGLAALRLSLLQDAAVAFQKTVQLRNDDALARYNLGRAWMGLSKFEEARQQFAEYVELRPGDPSGHCALGMTLAALERSQEATTEFERSIALEPAQTEAYYRLALVEYESRDFDAATKNLSHVLDRESSHTGALTVQGKIDFEQKDYPQAISILQRAVSSHSSAREAHYYLGLALARVGRKSDSDAELQLATRLEHEEAEHRRTVLILDPSSPAP